jgi:ribonuclease P protein component
VGAPDSQPPSEERTEAADCSDPEQIRRRLTNNLRYRLGFPRRYRLTRGVELQSVVREGKRIRTMHLDVRVIASPLGHPRVGIVVPRYSGSAVDRNRLKRRLRELVRIRLLSIISSVDVVIRARSEAYAASFEALEADITRVAMRVPRLFSQ